MFRRPHDVWRDRSQRSDELWLRAGRAAKNRLQRERGRMQAVAGKLHSLSPLDVLGRGYSVTTRDDDGRLVTDAAGAAPGDRLRTRVARAEITSRVETIRPVEPPPSFEEPASDGSAKPVRKSETEVTS
jgi:exodeoxyribonuclease VII large subunit